MSSQGIDISAISREQLEAAFKRESCRRSFFFFVREFWDVIIKEAPVYNWHIEFLCQELEALAAPIFKRQAKAYDLIINIPPGTTKSTIVTIMYPAWLWVRDQTMRIITNSYSMDLSIEHATKSRDIITSDKYRELFPEVVIRRDKAAKTSYENEATGARYTTSTGGTITGKHGHLIINDDPLNPQQAASDADRKTANEHTKTLSSRKVDKKNTPTITIMQRLHEDDVTGYLLKKKGERIRHICLPATDDWSVKPDELRSRYVNGYLDPLRLSQEALDEQKTDLGAVGYAGQFGQSPVAAGGNIVTDTWFKKVTRAEFNGMRDMEPIIFFGDTAYTEKNENDPSGFIATCRIGKNLYITHAQKVLKKFPDLCKFVPVYVSAHGYTEESTIRIEPKATGQPLIDMLAELTNLNITRTPTPTVSKVARLTAVSPKIEVGRVFLVEGEWNEEFITEVCGFPNKAHDEYVDILGYAINYHLAGTKGTNITEILNSFL